MISVIMPYYERQAALDKSMGAWCAFYKNLDLEFSICDDGSPTPVIAYDCKVTTLPYKDHALNPCVPINRAVEASSGNVLILTNPEIVHREPIVAFMLRQLDDEMDYVIAPCWDVTRERWLAHPLVKRDDTAPIPEGSGLHFCAMFTRTLWDKAGGFDEDYREGQGYEDNDWLWRAHKAGARFKYSTGIVDHQKSTTRWPQGGLSRNRKLFHAKWFP